MRKLSQAAAHALAGEYVVGTLRGAARRRFEAMMRSDAQLRAIVDQWEAKMTPLADAVAPVEPPARVWKAIEERIESSLPREAGSESSLSAGRGSLWSSLAFWRNFGLVTGGLASVLLATFIYLATGPRGEPVFVAVLQDEKSANTVRTVISMHSPNLLRVRHVKAWSEEASGRALELWVIPAEGAPRSLGTVDHQVGDTMIEITASDPRVQGILALALTVEPPGGSPTGKPTGPTVARGVVAPVKRT